MPPMSVNPSAPASEPLPTGWRVPASLLALALPIIASMCSRTAMSFVDFVMVSQLGTEAQAAILPAGILLFCVFGFGMGVLTAVNTFVSQALGRRDFSACGAFAWQGVHLSLATALAVLPLWPLVPPFFAWVGHEPQVQAMEVAYVQIGLLSAAPTLASVALANFFNGIHRPAVGLWSTILANLFNIAGNYVLIFGKLGAPALGVAGAAWATLLASLLQSLILLGWMLRPAMAQAFHTSRAWRLDTARFLAILRVGLPAGFQSVTDIVSFTIFTLLLVGRFSTEQLAANNIVFKLLEVSFMPAIGLGTALTAAVGKAIGHGRPDYARLLTRWAAGFSVLYMGLIGAIYLLGRGELAARFNDDPEVIAWTSRLLICCAVFQVFDALGIAHISALRGVGDNRWPAILCLTLAPTLFLGGGYLMAVMLPQWGAMGPWITATLYICIIGLSMWARWRWGPWERIDLFASPLAAPAVA
jgi:MATE family multidrug resistance protein